ncbi:hypothetical protein [Microtetraspora malaysiensis]|uniref:hypothetical protein n=1 Tax=Microtetraspora malaysiensis TaxID=161358 RepID=UPI0008328FB9|nr:hypothetical protein [Microtetraspora malaysiensis]
MGGILAAGVGLLVLLGGGGVLAHAVSNSRQEIPNKAYRENLWRNVPVESLLPAEIGLQGPEKKLGDPSGERGWRRVAVSPETSCDKTLSGKLAEMAAKSGCVAAVRATYLDITGGTAATIAIVTFKEEKAKSDAVDLMGQLPGERPDHAVHALAAPGTKWNDGARAGNGGYPVMDLDAHSIAVVTAGPADGRTAGRLPQPWGRKADSQRQDRSPWGETANGLAATVAWRLSDLISKAGARR